MAQETVRQTYASVQLSDLKNHMDRAIRDLSVNTLTKRSDACSRLVSAIMNFEDESPLAPPSNLVSKLRFVVSQISEVKDQFLLHGRHENSDSTFFVLGDRGSSLTPLIKIATLAGSYFLFHLFTSLQDNIHECEDSHLCPEFSVGEWIVLTLCFRKSEKAVNRGMVEQNQRIFEWCLLHKPDLFKEASTVANALHIACLFGDWAVAEALLRTPGSVSYTMMNKRNKIFTAPPDCIPGGMTPFEVLLAQSNSFGIPKSAKDIHPIFDLFLDHDMMELERHRSFNLIPLNNEWLVNHLFNHPQFTEERCWTPTEMGSNNRLVTHCELVLRKRSGKVSNFIVTLMNKRFSFFSPAGNGDPHTWLPVVLLISPTLFLGMVNSSPDLLVNSPASRMLYRQTSLQILCVCCCRKTKEEKKEFFRVDSPLFDKGTGGVPISQRIREHEEELCAVLDHTNFKEEFIFSDPVFYILLSLVDRKFKHKFPAFTLEAFEHRRFKLEKEEVDFWDEIQEAVLAFQMEQTTLSIPAISPTLPTLQAPRREEPDGLALLQSQKKMKTNHGVTK